MDWDLKMPPAWDLAELEHDAGSAKAAPAAAAVGGPASSGITAAGRPECSVDLKLGGLGEFGAPAAAADSRKEPAPAKVPAAASPSPAKRPRPSGGGGGSGSGGAGQCPSCAVDGCKADLSKCRDYHRRHKVCEAHSKTPVVVVAGREMRFCQQCSRFHLLAEFDEAKRSCRKRLDGHNRRRRKPQPETMNSASFITSQQGARFSSFPSPRPEPNWPGIIKTESPYYTHQIPLGISNRQHFVGSTSTYTKESRRFPFLQEGEINFATGVALEASVCQPLLETVAPPESSSKMFSDGLTPVLDSDCALSLLSAPANSSGIDVSRMVQPTEHIPMAQPLMSSLQFGSSSWFARSQASIGAVSTARFSCPAVESEQLNTVLSSNDNGMNYNGIFHVGGEGSSDGTSPSLPFSWQ
uniref:Squamosa-promoter binding protein-like protein n=1 Tax=Phyllostachys edulis TaxID=38705 RepID=A0A3Q8AHR9_PHYED|nr:squamosa-promoter binding protein-like protein [Phyllostachys edulis]